MPQESPAELGISADPLQPGVGSRRRFVDRVRAEVGQLAGLQVPPDQLYGVEVVRIGDRDKVWEVKPPDPANSCLPRFVPLSNMMIHRWLEMTMK